MEIIILPLFDLKYDKIAEPIAHTLDLRKTILVYHFECYMNKFPDDEDEAKGWIEPKEGVYQNIWMTLKKDKISAIESSWMDDSHFWILVVTYDAGTNEYIRLKFKKEKELREVESKIIEWLIV